MATRYIVESGLVNGKTKIEQRSKGRESDHPFIRNDTVRGLFRALTQAPLITSYYILLHPNSPVPDW